MLTAAAALAGLAVSGTPYVKSMTLYENPVASIDATCEADHKLYHFNPVNNSKSGFMSTTDAPGCTPSVLAQGDVSATNAGCWSVAFIREGESVVRTFGAATMFDSNTPAFQLAVRTWIDMVLYHNENPSLQEVDNSQVIPDILGGLHFDTFRPGNDRDGYITPELIQDMKVVHLGPGKNGDRGFPCNTCVKGFFPKILEARLFQRCNQLLQEVDTANSVFLIGPVPFMALDLEGLLPEECLGNAWTRSFQENFPELKKDVFIECGEM